MLPMNNHKTTLVCQTMVKQINLIEDHIGNDKTQEEQNKMQRMSWLTLTNGVGTFVISTIHLLADFAIEGGRRPSVAH